MKIMVLKGDDIGPHLLDNIKSKDVTCSICSTEHRPIRSWQVIRRSQESTSTRYWVCSSCKEKRVESIKLLCKTVQIPFADTLNIGDSLEILCPRCKSISWSPLLVSSSNLLWQCDLCHYTVTAKSVHETLMFGESAPVESLITNFKNFDTEPHYRLLFATAVKDFIYDRTKRPTALYLQQKYGLSRFEAGRLARDILYYMEHQCCDVSHQNSIII